MLGLANRREDTVPLGRRKLLFKNKLQRERYSLVLKEKLNQSTIPPRIAQYTENSESVTQLQMDALMERLLSYS